MSMEHPDYITITQGMSGHFAVYMRYYEDTRGYDVMQTGLGRYSTQDEAESEAIAWSIAEEVQIRLPRQQSPLAK